MGARAQCGPADRVGEAEIPAGSIVLMAPWAVHRDPRLWPDPERFDPDRHLPDAVKSRPRFAYFPFSGGSRKCIGDRFAMMEGVLILATLLQRTQIANAPGHVVAPEPALTLRPKNGIWQDVSARS